MIRLNEHITIFMNHFAIAMKDLFFLQPGEKSFCMPQEGIVLPKIWTIYCLFCVSSQQTDAVKHNNIWLQMQLNSDLPTLLPLPPHTNNIL